MLKMYGIFTYIYHKFGKYKMFQSYAATTLLRWNVRAK